MGENQTGTCEVCGKTTTEGVGMVWCCVGCRDGLAVNYGPACTPQHAIGYRAGVLAERQRMRDAVPDPAPPFADLDNSFQGGFNDCRDLWLEALEVIIYDKQQIIDAIIEGVKEERKRILAGFDQFRFDEHIANISAALEESLRQFRIIVEGNHEQHPDS